MSNLSKENQFQLCTHIACTPVALFTQLPSIVLILKNEGVLRAVGAIPLHRPDNFPVRTTTILLIYPIGRLGNWALEKYFTLRKEGTEAATLDENENAK